MQVKGPYTAEQEGNNGANTEANTVQTPIILNVALLSPSRVLQCLCRWEELKAAGARPGDTRDCGERLSVQV